LPQNTIVAALNNAITSPVNRMTSQVLNDLTSTQFDVAGGFNLADGYFDIASSIISSTMSTGEITKIQINVSDTISVMEPINITLTAPVTNSTVTWSYPIISGFDFENTVSVFSLFEGNADWVKCVNGGNIPQITVGSALTNKKLYFKVAAPALDDAATIDPALMTLKLEII